MIGIQLDGDAGAVAVWRESGPEVIGRGGSIADLVALAKGRDENCSAGVVAVPAWYNDEERTQIFEQTRAAGVSTVRLMNEPAAATLAYGASQAGLPETSMVLNLTPSGAFDVTLIGAEEGQVEVLASNGIADLKEYAPDQLFAAIEPAVNRAVSDARLANHLLDVIILTGVVGVLRSVASQIEVCWGRAPVEPPFPETAVACGAAVYGGFLETRQ